MGMSYVRGTVSKPGGGRAIRVRFLVDTGAVYTVLPERVWKALQLRARRSVEFTLADGTIIVRPVSECRVALSGVDATSPVVLGSRGDGPLLGAVTLETLGLMVNPLSRTLLPMRMTLAPLPMSALPPSARA
jgi:clan AA aspartic protease